MNTLCLSNVAQLSRNAISYLVQYTASTRFLINLLTFFTEILYELSELMRQSMCARLSPAILPVIVLHRFRSRVSLEFHGPPPHMIRMWKIGTLIKASIIDTRRIWYMPAGTQQRQSFRSQISQTAESNGDCRRHRSDGSGRGRNTSVSSRVDRCTVPGARDCYLICRRSAIYNAASVGAAELIMGVYQWWEWPVGQLHICPTFSKLRIGQNSAYIPLTVLQN